MEGAARKAHWERIYTEKPATEVSWYQSRPDLSMKLIHDSGATPDASVIDVGGGASTLVDALLDEGFTSLTVLDVSAAALDTARRRLGTRATQVKWIVGDITRIELPQLFDLWHDRAVFHFLTVPDHRRRYVANAIRFLKPSGTLIMSTFALSGPPRCSGLEVVRYDGGGLSRELGDEFLLVEETGETHATPWNATQEFIYCRFKRRDAHP